MAELLTAKDVRVRFRTLGVVRAKLAGDTDPYIDAVMRVSFSLAKGETLGLVGESGSGKTTLGRAVIGLVDAESGSITFEGKELIGLPPGDYKAVRRQVAMMFQDPVASLSPRKPCVALSSSRSRSMASKTAITTSKLNACWKWWV